MSRRAETNETPGLGGREREQGLALLVVLWIVVAATLLVVSFSATVRSGAVFVASEVELAKTEALLDAGAEIAATRLIDTVEERRWLADGKPHRVIFGGAELAITIDDPNGLIDLNKTKPKILVAFLRQFMDSEMKAGQIRDIILKARAEAKGKVAPDEIASKAGRDSDEDRERVPEGRLAFIDVAQLRRTDGVGAEIFDRIAPFLTVYGRDGRINPLGAPAEVLAAIPDLTRIDIERVRDALRSGREKDDALKDVMQRAGSELTDISGPAFVVTVVARRTGERDGTAKVFVIATGLDKDAPYRVISKKPLVLAGKVQ